MQALVKTSRGKGNLELREVPEPKAGPGEVLLAIRATGICGTDLHIEEDVFPTNPPVIIGHEFAAEIMELGAGVAGWKVGDRVACEPHRGGCGVCRSCLTGMVEVCAKKKAIGYRVDGCFTRLTTLPASSLHALAPNIPYDVAALTEPLAVVVKAVLQRGRVEPGDLVVVLGSGPIGLLSAAAAKAAGAGKVVITGTSRDRATRLEIARTMGIDHCIDVQTQDLKALIQDLSNGQGADLVVEATGVEPAIAQGIDILRIDGRMACLGITGRDQLAVPWDQAMKKAARIVFSYSSNWQSWETALSLLATGRVGVRPLISAKLPLSRWHSAFERLRRLEAVKIILDPWAE